MKINKLVLLGTVIILLAAIGGIVVFIKVQKSNNKYDEGANAITANTEELSGRPLYYPDNIHQGMDFSELIFFDENQNETKLKEHLNGEINLICYWGSWCQYCDMELQNAKAFENVISNRGDTSIILVDKMDEEKESLEKAIEYLKEKDIKFDSIFDLRLDVYNSLGMKRIPTNYFLDSDGKLIFCYTGIIESGSMLESMLDYAKNGPSNTVFTFLEENMILDGGMITSIEHKEEHPSGSDVLSESQGLLMEYAVLADNQKFFDEVLEYTMGNMYRDGMVIWYYSPQKDSKKQTEVNAVLDDFRIYKALCNANQKWGGYDDECRQMENTLVNYAFSKKGLAEYYDEYGRSTSDKIALCYYDLGVIKDLKAEVYNDSVDIIENGYISDDFPFYYSSYSVKNKKYSEEALNMSEALYTVLNLAKDGRVKTSTLDWIRNGLKGDGIMAGYNIDGSVADGKGYESTGVYAICMMIGVLLEDDEIIYYSKARMESAMVFDSMSRYNGGFGNSDGSGIYSFDQCTSLLAFKMDELYLEKK